MKFRKFIEALEPISPDHILPNVHNIVPEDIMKGVLRIFGGLIPKMVTIYHGGSWKDDPLDDIKPGDWVALEKWYAKLHADARGSKVISKKVPAEHVSWAGTDMNEWFYTPK